MLLLSQLLDPLLYLLWSLGRGRRRRRGNSSLRYRYAIDVSNHVLWPPWTVGWNTYVRLRHALSDSLLSRGGWQRSRAIPRCKDQLRRSPACRLLQQHVHPGPVQQALQNFCWRGGPILAKDPLIIDASGDLHSGHEGDLLDDLPQAGVVRVNLDLSPRVNNSS